MYVGASINYKSYIFFDFEDVKLSYGVSYYLSLTKVQDGVAIYPDAFDAGTIPIDSSFEITIDLVEVANLTKVIATKYLLIKSLDAKNLELCSKFFLTI